MVDLKNLEVKRRWWWWDFEGDEVEKGMVVEVDVGGGDGNLDGSGMAPEGA